MSERVLAIVNLIAHYVMGSEDTTICEQEIITELTLLLRANDIWSRESGCLLEDDWERSYHQSSKGCAIAATLFSSIPVWAAGGNL